VLAGELSEGAMVDARRSFYLAALRDDLGEMVTPSGLDCNDILFIEPANDNFRLRLKNRLRLRGKGLLRRLLDFHR
jgi:hypothetical protein